MRCVVGTILAVMADLAGPPKVLVSPRIRTIRYICHGDKRSVSRRIAETKMSRKLNACVEAINFFLSIESAKAPPNRVAGICEKSWTMPISPNIKPEPVSW